MDNKRKYEICDYCDYIDDDYMYYADINNEQDFNYLSDDRFWTSNVEDINGGDNFADYCKDIFNLLEEEEYYDN